MSIYQKRYDKLINHYKNAITEGYTERHHIIPKCIGGSDDSDNLVDLPAKAHYIAHWLLIKIYPTNKKMLRSFTAFRMDKYGYRKYTAAQYAKMSEIHAQLARIRMLEYHKNTNTEGANNHFYGKRHSEKSRKKMSEAAKNRKTTQENEQIRISKISKAKSKPCLVNGIPFNSVGEAKEKMGYSNGTWHRHKTSGKIKVIYT